MNADDLTDVMCSKCGHRMLACDSLETAMREFRCIMCSSYFDKVVLRNKDNVQPLLDVGKMWLCSSCGNLVNDQHKQCE